VTDGFEQLVDDRHRRRVERLLARAIEDEAAAGAGEQAEDDRMLRQNGLLEFLPGIAVELEHRGVELQDVLVGDFTAARLRGADDGLEVGRQLGGARRRGELRQTTNCQQRAGAAHESCGFHGFLLLDARAHSIPASSPPAAERDRRRSARHWIKGRHVRRKRGR